MRKIITMVLVGLLCTAVPALAMDSTLIGGTSISPHADGVCAPNDPIAVAELEPEEETDLEDVAPEEEEEPAEEPEPSEPEEEPEWTVREMAQANHDGDGSHWYHIEDEACPGHEWAYSYDGDESFRYCLNCGRTEPVDMPEESEEPEIPPEAVGGEDGADEDGMEIIEAETENE